MKKRKRKWIIIAIIAVVLAMIGGFAAYKWEDCQEWEDFREALTYQKALRYDEPFGPAIARADRIVVRADGFDCCGPVDDTDILFVVTDPA